MSRVRSHPSWQAADYAAFRPSYPNEFIESLVSLAPARDLAWDCATGTGQAAVQLASHFTRVLATDASADQLSRATPHPRVAYRVAVADDSGAPDQSVDLVTVAQAVHWFDRPRFYDEVRRVLKRDGAIAVWCYGRVDVDEGVNEVMRWFEDTRLRGCAAPELDHVHDGYRHIEFPFEEISAAQRTLTMTVTLEQLLGFVSSWSAVAAARRTPGRDPVDDLRARLLPLWPTADAARVLRFPMHARVGRLRR